jgi:alpha-L-rhamnosidase
MWTYGSPLYCAANMNIAWEHYLVHGDPVILEEAYTAGKKWLDFTFQTTREGELFTPYAAHSAMFLGDWLGPGPRTEFGDLVEAQFFNNCVHVMTLQLLVDIAETLGRSDEAASYLRRIAPLKAKIHDTYYHPATRAYANGDQVRTAWALFADVVPDSLRPALLAHLKDDMTGAHPYFDIGASSKYPYFKTLLAHPGVFHETVAGLLSKTTYPSYGYFLQQDETTWPEAWEARVDAHVHTSYVGISAWLIKGIAGIETAGRRVTIRPRPTEQLTFVRAAVQSPYGAIESAWRRSGSKIIYEVTIPVGVKAGIYLPDATKADGYDIHEVTAGKYKYEL